MGLTFTIPKFILFCLNFLLVIIGLALIAVGSWVTANDQSFIDTVQFFSSYNAIELQLYQETSLLRYFGYAVIIIGSLLVVITFVGCWGVVIENRGLLMAFTGLMIALVLLEGGAAAAMGGTQSLWKGDYEKSITSRFVSKYRGTFGAFPISEFEDYSLRMDKLMIELECCGLNGSQDFSNTQSRWFREGRKYSDGTSGDAIKIPPACCKYTSKDFWRKANYGEFQAYLKDKDCVKTTNESNMNVGCLAAAKNKTQKTALPFIVIPIILFLLQIATIGISIFLICRIQKWDNELYY
ncbi:unnamed protein product [Schistosoma spindalis]|nr:unnamed protein product [Schistosoma spindale]